MLNPGWVHEQIATARVARLATADAAGVPHVVPVTFALVGDDRIVTVVDGKMKSTQRLKRLANIYANAAVSVLVDHYDDDWSALWWIRIDGRATVVHGDGPERAAGLDALHIKYRQYRGGVATDGPLIVISVVSTRFWRPT